MAQYAYGQRKTLDPKNQFIITCPVFNVNTKIAGCFALRNLIARAAAPATRKGCQVALEAGKCPIHYVMKDIITKDDDPYHSVEAKVGSLRKDVLERIAPVLVLEKQIERAGLSPQETAALMKNNEAAKAGIKNVKRSVRPRDPTNEEMEAMMPTTKAPVADSKTIEAAKSGDMAAAVNAAIKEST